MKLSKSIVSHAPLHHSLLGGMNAHMGCRRTIERQCSGVMDWKGLIGWGHGDKHTVVLKKKTLAGLAIKCFETLTSDHI